MTTISTTRPAECPPAVAASRRRRLPTRVAASLARAVTRLAERLAVSVEASQLGPDAETEVSRWSGARI